MVSKEILIFPLEYIIVNQMNGYRVNGVAIFGN